MSANTTKSKDRNQPPPAQGSPISSAPRQRSAHEAWMQFADRLFGALVALEEDEFLVLQRKGTNRYVQFMDEGAYGMRVESVSDYYLDEDEHLSEGDYKRLMELGWQAPTRVPDVNPRDADGSPNYYLDLAHPIPLEDVVMLAIFTLTDVHGATHPGQLEYDALSIAGQSIRFPHLMIRRRRPAAQA